MFNLLSRTSLCFLILTLSTTAQALNANFTLKGEIVKSACTLKMDHIDVPLGEIDKAVLIKNRHSSPVDFTISLTDCDPNLTQSVSMIFTAEGYPNFPNKIKPTGATTAEGVAIGVYYNDSPIQISESTPLILGDIIKTEDVEIPFTARMETIGNTPATTGDVEGFLNFTIEYE